MRRLFIAAIVLAAFIAVPLAMASQHVHCGSNHLCIARVARTSCTTRHDPWHCRIWHRWEGEQAMAHTAMLHAWAKTKVLTEPVKVLVTISPRDLCVANRESGSPGAYTYLTVDWDIDTGNGYTGGYQFEDSTWQEAQRYMGLATEIAPGKYSYAYGDEAWTATSMEQTAVFDYWAARYPTAWPNTGPPCGL